LTLAERGRPARTLQVFRRIVSQMRKAAGAKLDGDPVRAVEVLSRKHGLNSDEHKGILRYLAEGGDLSL
jgi:hypothetical protein